MRRNLKRGLATLLSAMMVITAAPATGFAATDTEQKPGWSDDGNYFYWNEDETELIRDANVTVAEEGEATCTEAAWKTYSSTHADENSPRVYSGEALGHDPAEAVKENVTEATCTAEGKYDEVVYCKRCGEELSRKKDQKIAALGHKVDEAVYEIEEDPEDAHNYDKVWYCEVCGAEVKRETVTGEHDYVFKEHVKAPICGESDGEDLYECSICGETMTKVVPMAKAHTKPAQPMQEKLVEATCEKDGSFEAVYYCETCGKEIERETVVIPAKGHNAKDATDPKVTKEATCYEEGTRTYTCPDCKKVVTEAIPKTEEHVGPFVWNIVRDNTFVEATCEEGAKFYYAKFCTKCGREVEGTREYFEGAQVVEDLPSEILEGYDGAAGTESQKEAHLKELVAQGHDWDTNTVKRAADCKAKKDGVVTRTCKKCGAVEVDAIIPYSEAHEWGEIVKEDVVPATCTEDGHYTKVRYCTICKEREEVETVVEPMKDHEWKVTKNPTCDDEETDGRGKKVCKVCGLEEDIDSLGEHDWVLQKDAGYEPTCGKGFEDEKGREAEKDGKYFYKCSKCGKIYVRTVTLKDDEKKNHVAADPVKENVKKATCTEAGSYDEVVYCKVCGLKLSSKHVDEPALGHQVYCNAQDKCVRCGKKVTEADNPEIVHDYKVEGVIVLQPTCTEPGKAYVVCSRCGDKRFADGYKSETAKDGEYIDPALIAATKPLGHKYDESNPDSATVHWATEVDPTESHDRGYVVYTYICENDPSHKIEKVVNFAYGEKGETSYTIKAEKTDATCTKDGKIVYTFEETLKNGKKITSTNPLYDVIPKYAHYKEDKDGNKVSAFVHVEENRVEPTCEKDGSFDSVERCSICGAEKTKEDDPNYKREEVVLKALGHLPGEAVTEKFDEGDDTKERYDIVIYCSRCNKELERHPFYVAKGHKPGKPVLDEEESVAPTCTKVGKAVYKTYCLNDNELLDKQEVEIPAIEHRFGTNEREIIEEGSCTTPAKYHLYRVCSVCGEKFGVMNTTFDPLKSYNRDEEEAYYKRLGYYYDADRAFWYGDWDEIETDDLKVFEDAAAGHKAHFTKTVVTKEPTCTEKGASVDVTYCGICFEEISRSEKETEIPAKGHVAKAPVKENEVAAAVGKEGSYDEVVYCSVCGEEISRTTVKTAALPAPVVTPTPAPVVTPTPTPAAIVADGNVNSNLKGTQSGKKLKVTWGKVSNADGYDVYVQYCGQSFKSKATKSVSGKTSITLSKLNGKKLNTKKAYKLYVVAYKMVDGKKTTLSRSVTAHVAGVDNAKTNAKSISVKAASVNLSASATAAIKATMKLVTKNKKLLSHVKKFRYVSSNKAVATVSTSGKITAVGQGSCTIYVIATNGTLKKVSVTVA